MRRMDTLSALDRAGLFTRSVPRYTSYPPATRFHPGIGAPQFCDWLGRSDPAVPVSIYLHIPFCERLCRFCACRTQGTRTRAPVAAYLRTLGQEIAMIAGLMSGNRRVAWLHWGGGTPTILSPAEITSLDGTLDQLLELSPSRVALFGIRPDARALTCLIACEFDAYSDGDARHSPAT
jgi:oxygen-independent coproporphyrinogen III oxidase